MKEQRSAAIRLLASVGVLLLAVAGLLAIIFTQTTFAAPRETVTICHATSSGANPYIAQNPAANADVNGHDGHSGPIWFDGISVSWGDIIPPFSYDGGSYPGKNWTTEGMAIYDNDCNVPEPEPIDICPNIDDVQETVPEGYEVDEFGDCVEIDVCSNIEGPQTTLPDGYEFTGDNICTPIVVDMCPNIDDVQETVPEGYEVDEFGDCVEIDVCSNIEGPQTTLPDGYEFSGEGICTAIVVDICPNIEGDQGSVPDDYIIDEFGDCVPNDDGYAPYCGDGILNQDWEQCEGGEGCLDTCQWEEQNECSDLTLARVTIDDVINWNDGNATSDIFLGSDANKIPAGTWFPVYWNGSYYLDADIAGYLDVEGLAIRRHDILFHGLIMGLRGSHEQADNAEDQDKEHLTGWVEFSNTYASMVDEGSMENSLLPPPEGVYNPGNDFLAKVGQKAVFFSVVTTADDVWNVRFPEPIEQCDDDNGGGDTDVCPNIEGDQGSVPDGYELDENNQCVPIVVDMCPNIEGDQESVPDGYIVDEFGDCVRDVSDHACIPGEELVENGSFEFPVVNGNWANFAADTLGLGWNVEWADIFPGAPLIAGLEIQSENNAAWNADEGVQYAELDSDWIGLDPEDDEQQERSSTRISQELKTVPGETYTLSFAFAPRQGQTATENNLLAFISGGEIFDLSADGSENETNEWTTYTHTFVATDYFTEIAFKDAGTPNSIGTLLDSVSVVCEDVAQCEPGAAWAHEVVAEAQGTRKDGSAVASSRSDALKALGEADDEFYSLGIDGSITVKFLYSVEDVDGDDLSFHETTYGNRNNYPEETAQVEVSQDGEHWFYIGDVSNRDGGDGVSYLDFSSTGLSWIQYVRLTDTTAENDDYGDHNGDADGYDLDAIDATNMLCEISDLDPVPTTITIVATKVVCTTEDDLPNWGTGGSTITSTTATDYVAEHENCEIVEWEFQYGGSSNPGDDFYGEAADGWTTFTDSVEIDTTIGSNIWMREVLQSDYIPFSYGANESTNDDDYSAEFYCHTDALNYDNYDYVTVGEDDTYYCVGFNTIDEEDNNGGDDNNPPVIYLIDGDITITVGDSFTDPGATATDVEDGDLTDAIVVGGDTVDPNTPGTYTITYNVTDSDGASAAQVTRTVTVEESDDNGDDNGGSSNDANPDGGISSGGRSNGGSSGTSPQVLGAATSADDSCPFFTQYMRRGDRDGVNGVYEVALMQGFLNDHLAAGLVIDGVYGQNTTKAVHNFQELYYDEIIDPWNLAPRTTGRWYKLSRFKANDIVGCPESSVWLEDPQAWYPTTPGREE